MNSSGWTTRCMRGSEGSQVEVWVEPGQETGWIKDKFTQSKDLGLSYGGK